MNRSTLVAVTIMSFASSWAQAADRTLLGDTPVVSDRFRWNGAYVGVQGGYGEGRAVATLDGVGSAEGKPIGGFGGAHVGFNYQNELLVVGVEVDAEASGLTRNYHAIDVKQTVRSTWMASARGRFGLAYDRLLIYATAGIGVADASYKLTISPNGLPPTGFQASVNDTFYGLTYGVGMEYAFSSNFSMRAEWRATSFQNRKFSVLASDDTTVKLNSNLFRVGASYRF